MKDQFTLGWRANGNAVHNMLSPAYGECVCICEGPDRAANARLFAASRDLLAALKALLAEASEVTRQRCAEVGESYGSGTDVESQARAALAKATDK